jgi:hypothetical protein
MKYGIIATVFAMTLLSATLVHSVEAFRPSTTPAPADTTTASQSTNPSTTPAPADTTTATQFTNPSTTPAPADTTTATQFTNPSGNQVTVMGSTTYTDNEGHYNIIGEVKNNANQAFRFIRVTANLYDSLNRIIDTSSAYTTLEELRPQETSNFHIVFPNQAAVDQSGTYTLTVSPSQPATPKPQQLQVNYGNVRVDSPDTFTFVGEVTNQGNRPTDLVRVSASFYDANNQLVDVENVYAQPSILQPGQSASFEITASKLSNPSIAQIGSAAINVQSSQFSSVSMGQKVFVPATLTAPTAPTTPTSQQFVFDVCGKDTHLNKKGQCVADRQRDNDGDGKDEDKNKVNSTKN